MYNFNKFKCDFYIFVLLKDYINIYIWILQNIENFITFLVEWEKEAKKMNYNFITEQTCYGLKISLKATLEMCTLEIFDL